MFLKNLELQGNNGMKNKNFLSSVKCTISGILYCIKNERNVKIDIIIAILVVLLGFVFKLSKIEWCFIVCVIFFVIVSEMFNTAIEKTVDLYTKEYNEIAKIAKDVSSGAVMLSAICSVIVGCIIFLPKIIG